MRRFIIPLVLLAVVLLAGCTTAKTTTPTSQLQEVRVKLNWQDGIQFLGFYVAQANGYYTEEGLQVMLESLVNMSDVDNLAEQVADGEYHFAMGTEALVNGQLQGTRVTAIASLLQLYPGAFFARADSGITTPADFAGKRIVIKNSAWEQRLVDLLAREGLTLADIEGVPGSFDMTPFIEGDVDIWAGYLNDEVVHARLRGLDIITFPLYEYTIRDTIVPIFTTHSLLETQPDMVTGFLRATIHGWTWAIANPVKAVDSMLEQFPELAPDRDFHIASFEAYIPLLRQPGQEFGVIDCEKWVDSNALAGLDATDWLCTENMFAAATAPHP